ncbi:MAG: hypothetical protein K8S94_14075 [Planctomycetia bacterium]|nr:hypothetical protein [Planctomycetia bacterium]
MSRRAVSGGLIAIVLLAAQVTRAGAGGDDPRLQVTAGIGGVRRTGAWTPLVVSSSTGGLRPGETIHVAVEDPEGQFVRSPPSVVTTGSNGDLMARCCVRFGRPSGRVRVERDAAVVNAVGPAVEEVRLGEPIPSTESVIVVYGDLPATVRAARLFDREHGTQTRVVAVDPRGRFVEGASARDYDAADTIIVCGRAMESLPADVVAGIDAWVRDGGRLVFIAGGSAPLAAGRRGPVAEWLPGTFERMVPLRRPGAIESYARSAGLADRVPSAGLMAPLFAKAEGDDAGVVDLAAGEGASSVPLIVRRCRGFGTITWLGIDIDEETLRDWKGWDTLLFALLGGRTRPAGAGDMPEGGGDLAGQLRAALDTFQTGDSGKTSRPVPFELIAALGIVYVLCLYPFDWWLVTRAGRPWLSWITLPALAAAFTGGAWALSAWWGGGRPAGAHVAEIIDIDAASGQARGASWAAVFSPDNDMLDAAAAVPTAWAGDDVAVSWLADAGRGFAGVESTAPHPSLAATDYGYGKSLASLDGAPLAAASSRLFEAGWTAAVPPPVVASTLQRTSQGTLAGGVAHQLPFVLEQCRLLHAGWLYDVGTLGPGDRYDTETGRGPRSLASAITRRGSIRERELAPRWDATSTDVGRILEVAAFHAAAGGTGYTVFGPGRLGRLDLSPVLSVDRAVLVGVAAAGQRGTAWKFAMQSAGAIDVVPATATLCRIVIPLAAEPVP